jgi:hypothetical protein
MIIFSPRIMS